MNITVISLIAEQPNTVVVVTASVVVAIFYGIYKSITKKKNQ